MQNTAIGMASTQLIYVVALVLYSVGTNATSHSYEKAFFMTMPKPIKPKAKTLICKSLLIIITVYANIVINEPSITALFDPENMGRRDTIPPTA